jgi:hypothetical protein
MHARASGEQQSMSAASCTPLTGACLPKGDTGLQMITLNTIPKLMLCRLHALDSPL